MQPRLRVAGGLFGFASGLESHRILGSRHRHAPTNWRLFSAPELPILQIRRQHRRLHRMFRVWWPALSCNGGSVAQIKTNIGAYPFGVLGNRTRNIDRLAKEEARLPSSSPHKPPAAFTAALT
ncbi:hypothetical protein EOS93_32805 [Rhizobium sp. RMa-01]|uniref:hypothetical protein n=1 Tax=unclassified Rhizobium TaxID=2613769 RepID=UPI000FE06950|nr:MULTISPECIES: hypothetical protein [unclassified Rhizobium]RVU04353.1 hypothetical protein EOS93_32805 [Rhizobium sp. RMa-01]